MALPSNNFISLTIRGLQVFLSLLNLGLAAGVIGDLDLYYGRAVFVLIVTILTLFYEAFVLLKFGLRLLQPLVAIIVESILTVFWLAAFAVVADDIGPLSCEYTYYYFSTSYSYNWCRVGKALIAFAVIEWLTFLATLVLLIWCTIVPLSKSGGLANLRISDIFVIGGIFINDTDTSAPANESADLEKGVSESGEGVGTESSINHAPITDEGITINESIDANNKLEDESLEQERKSTTNP